MQSSITDAACFEAPAPRVFAINAPLLIAVLSPPPFPLASFGAVPDLFTG